jgi:hypothetical protein
MLGMWDCNEYEYGDKIIYRVPWIFFASVSNLVKKYVESLEMVRSDRNWSTDIDVGLLGYSAMCIFRETTDILV